MPLLLLARVCDCDQWKRLGGRVFQVFFTITRQQFIYLLSYRNDAIGSQKDLSNLFFLNALNLIDGSFRMEV